MRRRIPVAFSTVAVGSVMALLAIWVLAQREEAKRLGLVGRFCQLELALKAYHSDYGVFPPARYKLSAGSAVHSWRVLLLPYLGLADVYGQYRFDEPWNSPSNSELAELQGGAPLFFRSPYNTHLDSMFTDFVAADSRNAAQTRPHFFAVVADESQFWLADAPNSDIHWMEPRDE